MMQGIVPAALSLILGMVFTACQGSSRQAVAVSDSTTKAVDADEGTLSKTSTATDTETDVNSLGEREDLGAAAPGAPSGADDDKKAREVRSRKIGAIKDKLASKRENLKFKQQQRVSLVNMKTTIDSKGIESHNAPSNLGSVVGGVSQIGGDNAMAGAMSAGFGMWAVISEEMDAAEQEGKVLTAKEAINKQMNKIDAEISALEHDITGLEQELDDLIEGE